MFVASVRTVSGTSSQRKIVILQKRALCLIYFSKSKEHTVPFFLKSNCLPLPGLFFRDCSYLLYDINRQTAPVSILSLLKQVRFITTEQDLSLVTCFMLRAHLSISLLSYTVATQVQFLFRSAKIFSRAFFVAGSSPIQVAV